MKLCPLCNRTTADDHLTFCSRDGARLLAGELECATCATRYPAGFRYCPRDGADLVGAALVPTDALFRATLRVPAPRPRTLAVKPGAIAAAALALAFVFGAGASFGGADAAADGSHEPTASSNIGRDVPADSTVLARVDESGRALPR